ncbi:hypothetical protein AVEN_151393-1 [Araneus ventricosus]|uniref:Uncharacterized protein n=1 Tax=Araneus ventricosus TaxID=182803 RepID=A0A4Y2C9D9_ARAVE|nr:hypothetical protein AVEN_151393-1 [Araneus ventricosus]
MLAVAVMIRAFKSVIVVGYGDLQTRSFTNLHKKKSHGVRSDNHGGQGRQGRDPTKIDLGLQITPQEKTHGAISGENGHGE